MELSRKDIELMAPAGSYESLMAAIHAGADSVYFGMNKLNMRARSSANFNEDDLDKILKICNTHNVKTYLTLNIVFYDDELEQMKKMVDIAKDKGITAVIAADLAVINYARSKNVEVHISTQVNISNTESLKFYAQFADVMVLARELDLKKVSAIYNHIDKQNITGPKGRKIKIEMFIHGALCMSVSGKCYLSLHEQNYSANRGSCLQHCRKGYTVRDKETGFELDIDNEYILSPKDLCTIHFLNKLIDSGVRVMKIEGRARSPEYVHTVTKCYDEALKSYFDDTYNETKIEQWKSELSKVFNRGFWDGYYLGQRLGEWSHVYGSQATQRKIYVGKCTNYFTKLGVAEILCEASDIQTGDEIIITGPTTGVVKSRIEEIRVDLKNVGTSSKGEYFSIKVPSLVRRSDKLYKLQDVNKS
jgi:U32 family peptidase